MKRFLVCFLSLCLLLAFFVFPASADEGSRFLIRYYYKSSEDGAWLGPYARPLEDGWFLNGACYALKIDSIRYYAKAGVTDNVFLSFNFNGYGQTSGAALDQPLTTTFYSFTTSSWSGVFEYAPSFSSKRAGRAAFIGYQGNGDMWYPYTQNINYNLRFTNVPTNSDTWIEIKPNSDVIIQSTVTSNQFYPYISNIYVDYNSINQMNFWTNSLADLDSIILSQSIISAAVSSISSNFLHLIGNNYSYLDRQVDSDGNVTFVQRVGSWFDSVLGDLNSLLGDIGEQAEQLEKAKEAGALDSLEDAYDSAGSGSFGAIGDLGFGSLGNWSTAPFENAGNSVLDWFSQSCQDDLDTVPRTRSDDGFVDFYSDHYEDLLDLLGGEEE